MGDILTTSVADVLEESPQVAHVEKLQIVMAVEDMISLAVRLLRYEQQRQRSLVWTFDTAAEILVVVWGLFRSTF